MKYLKNIALALLFGAIFTASAFADGNPQNGGPSNGGPGKGTHYGLSDSCWKVFLSQLSPADQAKLATDQATISGNQPQIDALNKQIGDLLKGSNSGNNRDTTNRAKIMALNAQIETLNRANGAAQMDIDTILKNNNKLFETIAQNCGRPDKGNGGPRDTTKGGGTGNGNPPDKGGRGHFGLADSCWKIFLTQISADDAAKLAADQKTITDNQAQIDAIFKQIRALKGNAKDSATRVQIKGLLDQIKSLMKASGDAEKDYASIIRKNNAILQSIRKDCGRPIHKGTTGDPANGLTVSEITPNPSVNGTPVSITITLTADAPVTISISSATAAQGPPAKVVFNGLLMAGAHIEVLDLTGLKPGVYLVTVQSGSQQETKKLVIQ